MHGDAGRTESGRLLDVPVGSDYSDATNSRGTSNNDCVIKGNTLIDISPRPKEFSLKRISSDDGRFTELNKEMACPLYQRAHLKANKATTKEVTRYVHQH